MVFTFIAGVFEVFEKTYFYYSDFKLRKLNGGHH